MIRLIPIQDMESASVLLERIMIAGDVSKKVTTRTVKGFVL